MNWSSPIKVAVQHGHKKMVRLLLDHGADPEGIGEVQSGTCILKECEMATGRKSTIFHLLVDALEKKADHIIRRQTDELLGGLEWGRPTTTYEFPPHAKRYYREALPRSVYTSLCRAKEGFTRARIEDVFR